MQLSPNSRDLTLNCESEVFIAKGWLGKLIAISSKHFVVFRGHLLFQQDILFLACAYYCLQNNGGPKKTKTCLYKEFAFFSLYRHENMILFKKDSSTEISNLY